MPKLKVNLAYLVNSSLGRKEGEGGEGRREEEENREGDTIMI